RAVRPARGRGEDHAGLRGADGDAAARLRLEGRASDGAALGDESGHGRALQGGRARDPHHGAARGQGVAVMAQIDPAERLLNLIIALTHARTRMTRAQIRESVAGYEPLPAGLSEKEAARRDAAFERMFERDKDDLRRMGIPLQTVVDP